MWPVTDTILFLCPGWWIRRRWGFSSVLGRGGRKLTGAHLRLSQTLTQDPCQGWFSGGKSPGNQWWNIQDECSETLIGIHKARFRWGNDLPMNCSTFLASHKTRHPRRNVKRRAGGLTLDKPRPNKSGISTWVSTTHWSIRLPATSDAAPLALPPHPVQGHPLLCGTGHAKCSSFVPSWEAEMEAVQRDAPGKGLCVSLPLPLPLLIYQDIEF